jgi:CMP-N,N'-diacetyllegionaminic acid synthase
MEIVGLIPARSGSKGIPRKNLVTLFGKPLIAWTIEAAHASRRLTRTVVSTDSPELARVARELGADVPFLRPAELAQDETPMTDVVRHAVEQLGGCDVLVLLQPTSPLRRAEHIDAAVDLLLASGADCVVSVVPVPHQFVPESLMALHDGKLAPLVDGGARLRQEKRSLYARNGPAVLALRPERLPTGADLYYGDCRAFPMEPRDSVDVDGPFELELAELLLANARD